jgi:hypothetical protein
MNVGVQSAFKDRADKVRNSRDGTMKSVTSGGQRQRLCSDYSLRRTYWLCTLACRRSFVTRFEPYARKRDVCLRVREGEDAGMSRAVYCIECR